jgi:hypothetical protein
MAKFNPTKVVPTITQEAEELIALVPKEEEGEGYRADFAQYLAQGFIGQQQGENDETKK